MNVTQPSAYIKLLKLSLAVVADLVAVDYDCDLLCADAITYARV